MKRKVWATVAWLLFLALLVPAQAHHKPTHPNGPTPTPSPSPTPTPEPTPTPTPGDPRPVGARFIALGEPVAQIVNNSVAGSKFVIEAGTHNLSNTIFLKNGMELWGERQASLLSIPNVWYPALGANVPTAAHRVRPTTKLVFGPTLWKGIEGNFNGSQKLVDLELQGGIANPDGAPTGGPGTNSWGMSGRTVSRISGEIRRALIHHGEINCIGAFTGLIQDTELHSCGNVSKGFAAALLKTIRATTIQRVYAHDGFWQGLWADVGAPNFTILGTFMVDNMKSGAFYEVSRQKFLVANSHIWNNNKQAHIGEGLSVNGGVRMVSSQVGEIANSDIRGNGFQSVLAWNDGRCNDGQVGGFGWPINPLTVHDTHMAGSDFRIRKMTNTGCPVPVVNAFNNT